jgi:hypothetical protein
MRSPAGDELLRCALFYIGQQRHHPVTLLEVIDDPSQMTGLLGHASEWGSYLATLIEATYELPGDVVDLVRREALRRGWRLPEHLNVRRAEHLVDAAEARLGLEDAIESGGWEARPRQHTLDRGRAVRRRNAASNRPPSQQPRWPGHRVQGNRVRIQLFGAGRA